MGSAVLQHGDYRSYDKESFSGYVKIPGWENRDKIPTVHVSVTIPKASKKRKNPLPIMGVTGEQHTKNFDGIKTFVFKDNKWQDPRRCIRRRLAERLVECTERSSA